MARLPDGRIDGRIDGSIDGRIEEIRTSLDVVTKMRLSNVCESLEPRATEISTTTIDPRRTPGNWTLQHRSFALEYLLVVTV